VTWRRTGIERLWPAFSLLSAERTCRDKTTVWKAGIIVGAMLTVGWIVGEALAGTSADRLGAMALSGVLGTATIVVLLSMVSRRPGS
jgi:uncharacterized membrane protein YfcA